MVVTKTPSTFSVDAATTRAVDYRRGTLLTRGRVVYAKGIAKTPRRHEIGEHTILELRLRLLGVLAPWRSILSATATPRLLAVRARAAYSLSASAPPMISISSLVIAAWRARLYCRVRREIMSLALRVAASIAVI